MKNKLTCSGIVFGLIVLFIGASAAASIGTRNVPDPNLSTIELTGGTIPLVTCPAHDGPIYTYLKATVIDPTGAPMPGLPPTSFVFIISPVGGDTRWYGALSCTFTAVDPMTNANGEILFTIKGDTSIYGNITIQVRVNGIMINQQVTLSCKTLDYNTDGSVLIGDFVTFASDYTKAVWRSDFTGDGMVLIGDFVTFAGHYTHRA